jgi:hypothetical protein
MYNLPIKNAIALTIYHKNNPTEILSCLRLKDDPGYPNQYGLASTSYGENETTDQVIQRIMNQKLNIIQYRIISHLGKLTAPRRDSFVLIMDEYLVEIDENSVTPGQNYYQSSHFANPEILIPAANQGSLCSQICLNYFNIKY